MKTFYTILSILILLSGGQAKAEEGENHKIVQFIKAQHTYYTFREQTDLPVIPTHQEIEKALRGEVVVKKGESPGTGLFYVWTAKIMNVDITKVWLTLMDREHYDLILENIIESFISKRFENHFYTYNVLEAPLISIRHQVLDAAANPLLYEKSNGTVWEHFWHLTPDIKSTINDAVSQNKFDNIKPEYLDDAVVVHHHDGAWLLFSLPDGRTWTESYSINDPGGNIPDWILRRALATATEKTIAAYETWAEDSVIAHINNEHAAMLSPDGKWMSPTAILRFFSKTSGL